ncbi:MAG: TRAP transporter fused permease subunit [Desulfobacteraceae bacterium]|jgi:TRAP transporter 4TM/12TM fusion protein|nr:MAG: TRAP transporter fused permease subunit [Desulfobacteraceae bacterium]
MKVLRAVIAVAYILFNLADTAQVSLIIGFALAPIQARAISLGFVLIMLFLLFRVKRVSAKRIPWYDVLLIVMSIAATVYIFIVGPTAAEGRAYATNVDCFFAVLLFVPLIEGMRRTDSLWVLILGFIFILYAYFAAYAPGLLWGPGWGVRRLVAFFFLGIDGFYGETMSVFTSILIPFLTFGAFIAVTGIGDFFMDTANSLIGWSRGGAAKASIFGSGLMGMISGSAMANVAAVGTLTIPMMKKTGYKPETAAAIEAVASTGGQIMPPVMGATAFLMADFLGVPYTKVAIAAAIPASLYFFFLYIKIDIEAMKLNLKGIPRAEMPSFFNVMATRWHYLIPLVGLVFTMGVLYWRAEMCALVAIVLSFLISFRRKETALTPRKLVNTIERAARDTIGIGVLCAGLGMIVGVFNLTGLGLNLATILVDLAGGKIFVLLLIVAVVAIILGGPLPTPSVYFFCVLMLAPALIELKVAPMAAHMFVFYWGLAALISPPVAMAAYAAAPIAGASPNAVSFVACRFAIPIYLIPFVFIYHPGTLLIGSPGEILFSTMITFAALLGWLYAIEGYSFFRRLDWKWRVPSLVALILTLYPVNKLTITGISFMLCIVFIDAVVNTASRVTERERREEEGPLEERRSSIRIS